MVGWVLWAERSVLIDKDCKQLASLMSRDLLSADPRSSGLQKKKRFSIQLANKKVNLPVKQVTFVRQDHFVQRFSLIYFSLFNR